MAKRVTTIKDCTHKLSCKHVIGCSTLTYEMDCVILKKMPDGRLKILVFGDRYWNGHDEKKRIRYVHSNRISAKQIDNNFRRFL